MLTFRGSLPSFHLSLLQLNLPFELLDLLLVLIFQLQSISLGLFIAALCSPAESLRICAEFLNLHLSTAQPLLKQCPRGSFSFSLSFLSFGFLLVLVSTLLLLPYVRLHFAQFILLSLLLSLFPKLFLHQVVL